MANLTRYKQKIFANNSNQVGVFGTGTDKVASKNVETLQSADYEDGWSSAIITNKNYPVWQERDGVDYGFSYQLAYLLQKGIPEWLSTETYYTNDFCKMGNVIYYSLQDNNTNQNPTTATTYWAEFSSGSSRNIGEIVSSTMPLTDAGLHLLDGALISGSGSYSAFIDYIADLYDSGDYTAIFDTEANWQASVTLTGVCDKFVYDSINNTVRLPKYGNQIFTKSPTIASTVPVKGNGKSLGLTEGTNNFGLMTVATAPPVIRNGSYNANVGTSSPSGTTYDASKSFGVTTDGSKSGMVADLSSSLNNYPLDCYYYIVIATTTKTSIQVDIDEIATDLNGKMDTDGTNAVSSVKFADGQWVTNNTTLASDVAAPTSTASEFSLSSYLPNDNYNYEIICTAFVTTGSSSGSYTKMNLATDLMTNNVYVCYAQTRSASSVIGAGCCILPVGTGRTLRVGADSSNTGTYTLRIRAYRRIGTNQ